MPRYNFVNLRQKMPPSLCFEIKVLTPNAQIPVFHKPFAYSKKILQQTQIQFVAKLLRKAQATTLNHRRENPVRSTNKYPTMLPTIVSDVFIA